MCLAIGICWLVIFFIADIENDLSNLNDRENVRQNVQELKVRFCNIIQLFSEVKQLRNSASIFGYFFLLQKKHELFLTKQFLFIIF